MRLKRALSFISLSILLLLVFYCAHKVAPSGGPEDKTPPQIVKHFPNADSVGIRQLKYIEIEFSESIRQSTLPGNYWMVPEVGGGLEVKWKGGKKIRFYLQDTLAKNQTYVFTLGTGIKDLHNNAVEAPFQLAFSTGKKLDSGLITGKVYADRKEQDVFIYGYPINQQTDLDSLLFREAKYYTQIDIKGNYQLNYLPYGMYRVIALKDEDYNYVYNKGSDLIGLPFKDVRLDSLESSFSELNLFLIQEDSTGPEIRSIDTVSRREIKVEFNEPIQWSEFNIGVKDSSGQVLSRPKAFSYDRTNQTLLTVYFSDLPEKKPVILALGGAKDLAGNPSKPPVLEKGFTTATHSDTTKPRLLNITPQSNSSAIPYNTRISVSVNVPVDSL
ncbi:MAG: Ig-like domain-containing protein, partial [Anaerolineales bacterium]